MKKVMVFGVFDGLHPGHRDFLRQAHALGDELTVVLAPDAAVGELKGKMPAHGFPERATEIAKAFPRARVVSGDAITGSWDVVLRERPDVIALGYDQAALRAALNDFLTASGIFCELAQLMPHAPEKYKSSILGKKIDGAGEV